MTDPNRENKNGGYIWVLKVEKTLKTKKQVLEKKTEKEEQKKKK